MYLSCTQTCTCLNDIDSFVAIITISFEQESYIAMEGSSQPLQVCARTTDHIKSEQQLTVNAVITQAVGATQGIIYYVHPNLCVYEVCM